MGAFLTSLAAAPVPRPLNSDLTSSEKSPFFRFPRASRASPPGRKGGLTLGLFPNAA